MQNPFGYTIEREVRMLDRPELTALPIVVARYGLLRRQTMRTLYCACTGFHGQWSPSADELILQEVRRPELVEQFSLVVSCGPRHRYRQPHPTIFWGTPAGLVLMHDADPVAALGFEVFGDAVTVLQIQGVRGAGPFLRGVRWERLLLRAVMQIARNTRWDTVVVPATSDLIPGYAKQRKLCATAEECQQLDARYDRRYRQPAVSLGFRRSHSQNVFFCRVHG